MKSAGAATRAGRKTPLAYILGAVAFAALTYVPWVIAGDVDESATGIAWASAVPSPAPSASKTGSDPPAADIAAAPAAMLSPAAGASPAAAEPVPDPEDTPIGYISPELLRRNPNLIVTPNDQDVPPTTTEIPPAVPSQQAQPEGEPGSGTQTDPYSSSPDVTQYEREQQGITDQQQMRSLREFLSEGAITSPIGVQLREARRKLDSGEEADGLLIVDVVKGSPADAAGLHAYHRTIHNALTGVAVVAAMIFPPAILVVPAIDYAQVGESYDLIIGIDGVRVSNFLDFQDRMRDVQGGQIIYLSVVRDGKRLQIQVHVPQDANTASW